MFNIICSYIIKNKTQTVGYHSSKHRLIWKTQYFRTDWSVHFHTTIVTDTYNFEFSREHQQKI